MTIGPEETPSLTPAAFERLKAELEDLTTAGRAAMAERLLRAREMGDIRENAEFDETKNQQGMLEARIRQLQYLVKHARVVDAPVASEEVVPGILVTLAAVEDPEADPEVYLIASSNEERAPGARTVTVRSPLGQALVGRRVGEHVTYEAPGGAFTYQIVSLGFPGA
ncbi:MAG: transcription elongation factor GreA [Acidobacteria bacterium]|nr:transcription elongation factor GreA [Acidobacteriota bacterium]